MIEIFCGDDRIRAKQAIVKALGENYEIIEGAEITLNDLPSIFYGNSLFTDARNILIRDLSVNKPAFEKLPDYLNSPHHIIIQESKLDKRSAVYKSLKDKIKIVDFKLPENTDFQFVFNIYKTAKTDGNKAIKMLNKIKLNEEPIMFFGLLVSQALKDFNQKQGIKEKRVLEELSKLDLNLKTTSYQPWLLIESFLLRLSSLLS